MSIISSSNEGNQTCAACHVCNTLQYGTSDFITNSYPPLPWRSFLLWQIVIPLADGMEGVASGHRLSQTVCPSSCSL